MKAPIWLFAEVFWWTLRGLILRTIFISMTGLHMRLVAANHLTVIAPLARVHHGFASSIRRHGDRVSRDLFDIGASWAVFQRKFI